MSGEVDHGINQSKLYIGLPVIRDYYHREPNKKTQNNWQFFISEITNLFFPTLAAVLHGTYPVPGFFVGALAAGDRTEDALLVLQPCEPFL